MVERKQAPTVVILPSPKDTWAPTGPNYFERLTHDVLALILDYLDQQSILLASNVCKQFKAVIRKHFLLERRELICFHSKVSFREAVLGVAVHFSKSDVKCHGDIISMKT